MRKICRIHFIAGILAVLLISIPTSADHETNNTSIIFSFSPVPIDQNATVISDISGDYSPIQNTSEGKKSILLQKVAAADAMRELEERSKDEKDIYIKTNSGVKSASIICKFCVPEKI